MEGLMCKEDVGEMDAGKSSRKGRESKTPRIRPA